MRAGYALRQQWAHEAAAAITCPCGHPRGVHRGLHPSIDPVTFEFVQHPDYKPNHFHCDHCECVLDLSTKT